VCTFSSVLLSLLYHTTCRDSRAIKVAIKICELDPKSPVSKHSASRTPCNRPSHIPYVHKLKQQVCFPKRSTILQPVPTLYALDSTLRHTTKNDWTYIRARNGCQKTLPGFFIYTNYLITLYTPSLATSCCGLFASKMEGIYKDSDLRSSLLLCSIQTIPTKQLKD